MKKRKSKASSLPTTDEISPEKALQFLEDIRQLQEDKRESTQLISIRIPGNILRAIKLKAKADGKKYQSLIVEYIQKGLQCKY